MFKERLKLVGKDIIYGSMIATVLLVILSIFFGLIYLASTFPVVETIMRYTIYSLIGLVVLFLAGNVILNVCEFINWLFIEPYKARKKMKS